MGNRSTRTSDGRALQPMDPNQARVPHDFEPRVYILRDQLRVGYL